MKKIYTAILFVTFLINGALAQTGTEFWFAAPEVTSGHNDGGPTLRFTNTTAVAGTVTVTQPANAAFITTPNPIPIPANGTVSLVLDAGSNNFKTLIENTPTNTVLDKGLLITSTVAITAYYEVDNSNNNEIFALKGANGLGTEFYIPMSLNSPTTNTMFNHTPLTPNALSTFDIVATQNGTTIQIFSHVAVDGYAANVPFTKTLNRGQTYSCGFSGTNFQNPSNQPAGAVVLSDKPIAITVKEDSKQYNGQGCYDLIGDQIVPVNIVGTDYIVIKGQLNATAGESFFVLATQNNTNVYVNGVAAPVTTLFAGQTYFQDNITLPRYYIHTDKPVYCTQVTGFGCELGSALLPPLNCAGSHSVSFVRSTTEAFYLNIMVKAGNQGNFTLTGGSNPLCITAADFAVVPGTGGQWVSTYGKTFSLAEVPQGVAMKLTNSTDVFGMGLINGAAASGCRYGFFSEFAAQIIVDAGPNQTICGNTTATLNGSVTGGATTGIWTSSGSGTFSPNATALNAVYTPSNLDTLAGTVTLTLTSTSTCFPVSDQIVLTITDAPRANAGTDASVCINNPNYTLNGHVLVALGGQWSGGGGTFSPSNTTLNAVYIPTVAELTAGSVTLTLTTILNGTCNAVSDIVVLTYTNSPTSNAGPDFSVCANNPAATLSGSVAIATGGIWSGGSGTYNPNNSTLNAIYTPSAAEIAAGTVTLTLTTTGNGTCIAATDQVVITITPAPTANAGLDRIVCANNASLNLAGGVTIATGGVWSGGLGLYAPNNTTLNATYTPTALEILNGTLNLTLTTSGNGTCTAVNDVMTITIGPAPIANAGIDQSVCANNSNVTLAGSVVGATGGQWSGGTGTYNPNNSALNAVYNPSAAERTAGIATLILTTTGNGSCNAVTDQMTITITPSPVVNAGVDKTVCANNSATSITGTITGASGGIWSGGAGAYNPSNTALNVIYTPTAGEIAAGTVNLTLTSTGNGNCNAVSDAMSITITSAPTVNAGIDKSVCANNSAVILAGNIVGATGGVWSGGLGTFSPNSSTLNATYTPSGGEVIAGTVTLTLTSTGNGTCNAVTDQMVITITPAPTANAGLDQSVCFNNSATTLAGSVVGATGGQWSGGTGVFNPSNTALNAIYTPSLAERTAGTATLILTTTGNATCNPVTDQMTITITPAPIVNAGADKTVCANNPATTINASITGATGGIWTGGTGAFNPSNTALSIIYTPSAAEISAGSVTLTLSSTGNGNCNSISDQMVITITPSPIVNAGTDRSVCANNNSVLLAGSVTGATGGTWSGGFGTFSPNANTLNATYTPSASEITAGTLTLTLTSTGNGNCNSVSDQMIISITPAPIVNAGVNQTVCYNNPAVTLNGTISGATGGTWSGGSGSYSPNANTLNAIYTPTVAERTAGSVTLTLSSTGNGNCNSVSDQMTITITPAPTASAGIDKLVCANNPAVTINGNVSTATGGQWTGGTGSYNPANTALSIIYTPSAGEISAGTVTLTLTTTGNGNCAAVSDAVVITITPSPIVNAGLDRVVCANNASVVLAGTVSGATGGLWSGGLGTFSPDATNLNATYTPSAGEIAAGFVTLTLSSTGNGTCNPVSDQMTITITPGPTANAGTDITVGANNPNASLNGTIAISSGGTWSGGTGTYMPNANTLNAIYTPSAAEITLGGLDLTLTSTGNGSCSPVSDIVHITITAAPVVNAGINQTSCANNTSVTLNGTVSGATGGIWSGGTGVFVPNNTTLNAVYSPSAAEIAAGTVTLTLTSTGNGPCIPVIDQMIITITSSPIANAGIDRTVCSNNATILLAGSVIGATGGQWTGGLGFYNPNGLTLNASYTPTLSEISAGSLTLTLTTTGNGSCAAVTDQMTITFTPSPTSNANSDQSVCGNNSSVSLNGSISVATGGHWSGGSGTFAPNSNALNAVYTPTAGEIATGLVTLTLTTTGNGSCNAVGDNMIITINPAPIVNAGSNQNSCVNNPSVTLNGSVLNAGGGQWSGTTGTYNPGNTTMNSIYTPSPAEIAAGSVTITLTSTGNGSCLAVTDQMTINIGPAPIVNAGPDQTMCANNFNIQLNGSVVSATGGQWTGGLGLFTPNNNALNAVYTPTMGEIASGTLTLVLTSTGNGTCNSVSDNMLISFTPAPTVSAGPDQITCANIPTISLNGAITIATGGAWTGGNGTFIPNNLSLNATYTPSATEIALGTVTLTLTSTGNGNCIPVSDQMTLIISNAPIVNAGPDLTSCANNPTVTLNGNYIYAGGAIWSGGTGTYNPNNTTLNANYTPSAAEVAAGTVSLTLTTTGNGSCNPSSDIITITINPAPIVNAGIDLIACGNNPTLTLNGSIVGAAGAAWSGGLGSFLPNNSVLNATYTPTAAEISAGSVALILTSTGNGTCNAVSDQMVITYTPSPVANAGVNQSICSNNPVVTLAGSYSVSSGIVWSGGLGTFTPNNLSVNPTYSPTAAEILNGSVVLTLTTTGNGTCLAVSDPMTITYTQSPTVNAGLDQTTCVDQLNILLSGNVFGPTTTGVWTSSGTGTFIPNNTTLNATYHASSLDSLNGSVIIKLTSTGNGTCIAVKDSILITILPAGIANAGADQIVCANNANVFLNGAVSGGALNGLWSTSGSGTFVPSANVLNPMYVPSQLDTSIGTVTLTLQAISCNNATDNLILTITPAPIVDAGPDQTTCVSNLNIQLNGIVHGGTSTGIWSSSGTGIFTPSNTSFNAIYHASPADSISGNVMLILNSTNNGTCFGVSDTMLIHILQAGLVNAGPDQIHCSNNAIVNLAGNISGGATTGIWSSSGTGIFNPNNTTLNATYIPSAADTAIGIVNFVLSATNSCNVAFDVMQLTLTTAPYVDAGPNVTVCGNNADVALSGLVTIATGGIWSSSGTGTFLPNNTSLVTNYTPSAADVANGSVVIYLLSTNNGSCNASTDSMIITINPSPVVNAGIDETVCSMASSTNIFGFVNGGGNTGEWSTLGTGTFVLPISNFTNEYIFSSADTANGFVDLVLTSTNNGTCIGNADTVRITFGNSVFAYAGMDQTVCEGVPTVTLNGIVTGGSSTGDWSSLGTGTFIPDNQTLNAVYQFSSIDSILGYAQIVLTSTNNGSCNAGTDTVLISIQRKPIVNAGADIQICLGVPSVNLTGTFSNTSSIQWTSSGTGTFLPNDSSANVSYVFSVADSIAGNVDLYLTSTGTTLCSQTRDTVNIQMFVPVIVDFTYSQACEGVSINFNDNSTVNQGSITSWQWDFGGGNIYNAQDTSFTFLNSGTFPVTLTATSSLGCSFVITKNVVINPVPVVNFGNTSSCYKDLISFTDSTTISSGSISTWDWSFGNGNTSNVQNPQNLYPSSGTYNVSLTVVSNNGCSAISTHQVDVYAIPVANFGYTYNCANMTVLFSDSSTSQVLPINSWNWNFGDGNNSGSQNPSHIYPVQGSYNVQLIAGYSINCSDTLVQTINLNQITASFSVSNACMRDSVHFTDNSNFNGSTNNSWNWTFGNGDNSNLSNPNSFYSTEGIYQVSLIISTAQGCTDTATQAISIYPRPIAGFTINNTLFQTGLPMEFVDASTGAQNWQWDFGGAGNSTLQNPEFTFNSEGTYTVIQVVSNQYNCTDTARTDIVILNNDIFPPKVPTGFTPNADGSNDILFVRGGPFTSLHFRVFDQWGLMIFETNDPIIGWDGKYKNVDQPIGVYVWTVEAVTIDGQSYKKSGDVTLLR
ncbi:MAG: PKD domain-containing protein [Bacteroidetes bacterium]|nr:PKD domain-containing protein [Bacteroidota bacterium]